MHLRRRYSVSVGSPVVRSDADTVGVSGVWTPHKYQVRHLQNFHFISFMCKVHHDKRMNERTIKTVNTKWKKTENRMWRLDSMTVDNAVICN